MKSLNCFPKNIVKIFGEEFLATVLAVAGFKAPDHTYDYGLSHVMRLSGHYDLAKDFSAQVTASIVLETGQKKVIVSRLCEPGTSYIQKVEVFLSGHKLGQLNGCGWSWKKEKKER